MDVNIDFREDITDMIQDFGYPLLIQRKSNIFPCSCVYGRHEQLFNNSKNYCNLCNNSGKVIKLEKHNGIKCEHSPETYDFSKIGIMNSQINDFYFEHSVQLQENDLIFEVGWQSITNKREEELIPVNIENIFKVMNVMPTRGSSGRVEYVLVLSQKENINISTTQRDFVRNFKRYNRNFFLRGEIT